MRALQFALVLVLALPWSSGLAIEEPAYRVVQTTQDYEIRLVSGYIVAETLVEGDAEDAGRTGFEILAGYIFGKNRPIGAGQAAGQAGQPVLESPVSIAMAAPVAQMKAQSGYWVQFTIPSSWTLATLPRPDDPRVRLRAIAPRRLAVIRYTGTWSQDNYRDALERLEGALSRAGERWHGAPIWARYDPPWMPWFLRRNEVWLELDAEAGE